MRKTALLSAALVLAAGSLLSGCTDPAPTEVAPDQDFFTRAPEVGFDVVRRPAPLPRPLEVRATVGPDGGVLEIAEAGLRFEIPAGAVAEATEITMTALRGSALGVEFAPHGLRFDAPATMSMAPEGALADRVAAAGDGTVLDDVIAVYFLGDPDAGVEPLENLDTYASDGWITFPVHHFSGYVCASG